MSSAAGVIRTGGLMQFPYTLFDYIIDRSDLYYTGAKIAGCYGLNYSKALHQFLLHDFQIV